MVAFISELNNLELWATDIGNAYLEALMTEKIYIVAGQDFGELEGHMLIIYKALYGLRSSGLRWSQRLSECLNGMGFTPSKAEPDIWMQCVDGQYEYVLVYMDDLTIASKDPSAIIDVLTNTHGFKLRELVPSNITLEWFSIVMNMAHSASLRRYIARRWIHINSYIGLQAIHQGSFSTQGRRPPRD